MKSEKGITLISVIMYVLIMVVLIGLVATLITYFNNNISLMDASSGNVAEYNKFNMYFTKDTNTNGNYVTQVRADKQQLAFANGSTYTFQDNGIYLNKIKICTGISECQFQMTTNNNKQTISVYMVIGDNMEYSKTTEYTINIQ